MSVVAAKGFRAAGVASGMKGTGDEDLAIIVNDGPQYAVAGVFTRNRVQAAPVQISRGVVATGSARAVVMNSAGANACTGSQGEDDATCVAERAAVALSCSSDDVLLCSTGIIGERLRLRELLGGIEPTVAALGSDARAGESAARAIMTTDTVPKAAVSSADGWTVGGIAKGAGMLAPSLATMLCVLTTDAVVDAPQLQEVLREVVERTFNRLDSDGCTSTNDTVLLLSSGASSIAPDLDALAMHVESVCDDLCRQLLSDAEGSTKDIAIEVTGAACEGDAVAVGRAVARSNLVKCALFGNDPNWGRIVSEVGMADVELDPQRLSVAINGVEVCRDGAVGEDRSKVDLSGRAVQIGIDLGAGGATATIRTNDLSVAYVIENSAYSS